MAGQSGTLEPPVSTRDSVSLEAQQRTDLIESQIRRARSQVKGVELIQRGLGLVVGVVAFLLVAALVDHWVVNDGLPMWGRLLLWLALIAGGSYYLWRTIVPLLIYRVNPFYAARSIEETKPSLKNSLINYLSLREHGATLPPAVLDALSQQAAAGVRDVQIDHAVDRGPIIQRGYVLVGLLAALALYFIVSPKNPFPSIARVIVPWSDMIAPSRVQIVDVTPGTTTVFRGKSLTISARIEGLAEDEVPALLYSTVDQQVRDHGIPLRRGEDGRYTATLPELPAGQAKPSAESAGLRQDFVYSVMAGDARSQEFRVEVVAAPYIAVEQLEYRYPAYTKLPPEIRAGETEVSALEGTTVVVRANANQAVKTAWIDLRGPKSVLKRIPLTARDQSASGQWVLAFADPKSRTAPEHESYVLRFRAANGAENPEPLRHGIKVIRDEPPVVEVLTPTSAEVAVPIDRPLTFEIRAFDPDFALAGVTLIGMNGDQTAFRRNLGVFAANEGHTGNFVSKLKLTPADLKLKVGDVIDYYAEATDNKNPLPNVARTAERRLRVLDSQENPRNPKDDPLAQNDANKDPNDPRNAGKNPPGDAKNNPPPQQNGNDQNAGEPNRKNPPGENKNNANQKPQDPTARNPGENDPAGNQANDPRAQPPEPNKNPGDAQSKEPRPNEKQPNPQDDRSKQDKNDKQDSNNQGGSPSGSGKEGEGGSSKKENSKNDDDKNQKQNGKEQNDKQPPDGKAGNAGGGDQKSSEQQNGNSGNGKNDPQTGGKNSQKSDQQNSGEKSDSGGQGDPMNPNSSGEKSGDDQQAGDQQNAGQQGDNARGGGRPREQENKLDSNGADDAAATQKILEQLKKDGKIPESKPDQKNPLGKNGAGQKQDDQLADAGNQPKGSQQSGKPGEEKNGEQKSGQPKGNPQNNAQAGDKQSSGQSPNAKNEAGEKGNSPKSAAQKTDNEKTGNEKAADGKAGGEKNGDEKTGPGKNETAMNDKTGAEKGGNEKANPEKPESGKAAGKEPGDDKGKQPEAGKAPGKEQGKSGTEKSEQGNSTGKADGDEQGKRNEPAKDPGLNEQGKKPTDDKEGKAGEPSHNNAPEKEDGKSSDKSGNPSGSPKSQEEGKSKSKNGPTQANPQDEKKNDAESPSGKGNDSDSQGDQGGDRDGGGKKGGGQSKNQAGKGAAGSNSADDKGGSAANEKGDGETGTKAGDQKQAGGKTGKSGDKTGNGTGKKSGEGNEPGAGEEPNNEQRPGEGKQPGKNPGDDLAQNDPQTDPGKNPSGEKGKAGGKQAQPNKGKNPGGAGSTAGNGGGGQRNGNDDDGPLPAMPDDPSAADEANAKYADRATDLVLENMKDQLRKGEVDQDLLNKLGWTQDDMKKYVDRWYALKREAQQPGNVGQAASKQLNERLRNLGLRPPQTSRGGAENPADDGQRGNNAGRRTAPPSDYRGIYDAFKKGASGG